MKENTASRTARGVAAHRLDYARIETPYGDPAADDALNRDVAGGLDRRGTPMHEYLRTRTAFFDRVVTGSLDHRVSQVVVGGAGYDGRAFRYAKRGVRWFEVDHPATQADKRQRIARLGLNDRHITFVPADFTTDPVADLLAAAGLDASRPALFLLEGVAVYLEQQVLERLLAEFRAVTVDGSPLAISVSLASPPRPEERVALRARVAAAGEPMRTTLTAEAADDLLTRAGWRVDYENGRDRLRSRGLLLARAIPVLGQPERSRLTPHPHPVSPPVSSPAPVAGRLPLSALLSQALVALTIETDNEAEHRMPHRTQDHGLTPGAPANAPWQTSLVMWANCLRHVPADGITVAAMRQAARTGTNLDGMRRWRYVTYTPDPGRGKRPRPGAVVRLTAGGREARQVWDGLAAAAGGEIEGRWRDRFGGPAVDGLRAALAGLVAELDQRLPDCLPILGYGLYSRLDPDAGPSDDDVAGLPLWALRSRALLAFATEFEGSPGPSLAISANLLRVLTGDGVRVRDLPARSGVSKESLAMAVGAAATAGLVAEGPDPAGSRVRVARLTPAGASAQRACDDTVRAVEDGWRSRFGATRIAALRAALEQLAVGDPPPLFAGLTPYPDGWRARVAPRPVLPHYPMTLHRGAYPDGS